LYVTLVAFASLTSIGLPRACAQVALADGQFVSVPEVDLTGFTIVAERSEPFTAPDFSGTLYSTVLSRSDLSGLVFRYGVFLASGVDPFAVLDKLRIPGWSGITTSVWQDTFSSIPATDRADRLQPGVITWTFPRPPSPSIGFDSFTRSMYVLTNYDQFTDVEATLNLHPNPNNTFATALAFAPVPEPKTIVGLCIGLLMLGACHFWQTRRRWQM
jgi:hypothetical protein